MANVPAEFLRPLKVVAVRLNHMKTHLPGLMKKIEKLEGRELNYAVLSYDDFYYRMSVRDKFITEILSGKYSVLVDTERVLQ